MCRPSKRFDVFVPEKAAEDSPQIRFQGGTVKGRSNKALNLTERAWTSVAVDVPTNVSFPET